ncbi:MAG: heat-inducible transcriptional repressor HrcA [Armatimonadota bacterium]
MVELLDLDARKQALLKYVVHDYVATAEPVASKTLVLKYQLQVKSATVRHELAEMSEMGYLRQPHTSAGRIPSDRGYRVYVDYLMPPERPLPAAYERVRWLQRRVGLELEEVLRQTCRILASVTQYTAVASTPTSENIKPRQVLLTQLDKRHVLMVGVMTDGSVLHRILDVPGPLVPSQLSMLSDLLTQHATVGRSAQTELAVRPEARGIGELAARAVAALEDMLKPDDGAVVVEGASHMARQPEFRDSEKLEPILGFLEERRSLIEILRRASNRSSVTVMIGQESIEPSLQECSVVAARYRAGAGCCGAIGVIGPTRMEYRFAIPTVGLLAETLSQLLEELGIA